MWLAVVLLAITSSYTLVKTARDALFLSRLPVGLLPYVYIVVGVVTLTVSWLFGRLTQRLSPVASLVGSALASTIGLIAFSLQFESQVRWVPVAFYVWVNAYGLILVSQFWALTTSRSDPRRAKRTFGIIGGGGILGGLIGGAAAAWIGSHWSLQWITVLGAGLLAIVLPALALARRKRRARRDEDPVAAAEKPAPLTSVPYLRWLALAALCSVIVTGLLDFQLKVVVQQHYTSASQLASFFGRFYVAVNVAALLLQILGTGWLLQRLGAGSAAAVLPAGLAAGAAGTLLAPVLWTVLATRLWDQVLRFSLHRSAFELFYFPIEPGLRRRAKAFIEAGIERFGDALAGLLILAAGLLLEDTPSSLAVMVATLVVVWLVAWWHLRRSYVKEMGLNLRRMRLDPEEEAVSLRELGVLKEAVRTLESPYERVVLYALDLLELNAGRLIDSRLPRLLEHPSARVRARALSIAATRQAEEAREHAARLLHDPDRMVRLQALRVRCARGPRDRSPRSTSSWTTTTRDCARRRCLAWSSTRRRATSRGCGRCSKPGCATRPNSGSWRCRRSGPA